MSVGAWRYSDLEGAGPIARGAQWDGMIGERGWVDDE